MKTSTNKLIKGWNNTYAPKDFNVKVAEWLRENNCEDDANNFDKNATFGDLKKFLQGTNEYGQNIVDVDAIELEYVENGYMDSFMRDIIFDAYFAIESK